MLLSVLLSVHYRHHLANKLWARRFFLLTNVFSFSFSQRNYLDTMLSCYLFLVISLMISFRDVRVSASGKCPVICCAQRFFSPYFWGVECCCFKVIQQFDAPCFYYETQRLNYFIMSHVIKQMGGGGIKGVNIKFYQQSASQNRPPKSPDPSTDGKAFFLKLFIRLLFWWWLRNQTVYKLER